MTSTVLVIDNDSTQRQLICAAIRERLAYQTTAVANSREASEALTSRQVVNPDVILLDVFNTT